MESFEEMFARYFGRVYRFAMSLTRCAAQAEDITQQTFYKALKNIDKFEGRSDIGTWLCNIAKNEYFNSRKRIREQPEPPDSAVFAGGAEDDGARRTTARGGLKKRRRGCRYTAICTSLTSHIARFSCSEFSAS